ncbi:MAG: TonB-dependent receptor plug domain-containing protein [Bacteroidales bacterium]|nr:TonB-dependent receptor plug domain-containing protein [Bacteroidales bacterium]
MKYIFFCLLFILFIGNSIFAQKARFTDSVLLNEVTVQTSRPTLYSDGSKRIVLDSLQLSTNKTSNLGELLTKLGSINVSTYGTAYSASSVSLRGAGSNRTLITWAGFPLNSASLGSCDISTIPASGFNSISINYGAVGTLYGSGSFGGAVDLEYKPRYDTVTNLNYSTSYGSFKTFGNEISLKTGNTKFQYFQSTTYNSSASNYRYYDYVNEITRKRENAEYRNFGTVHYLYFKPTKTIQIGIGAWYGIKHINIPSIVGKTSYIQEHQKDSTLKTFADISYVKNKHSIKLKTAYFTDFTRYTEASSLETKHSEIYNKPLFLDLNYRCLINSNIKTDIGLVYNRINTFVTGFNDSKKKTAYRQ